MLVLAFRDPVVIVEYRIVKMQIGVLESVVDMLISSDAFRTAPKVVVPDCMQNQNHEDSGDRRQSFGE
jgi:hypothetical protein